MTPWLIIAALAVVGADPSAPIPPALQNTLQCMADTAQASPDVLSVERGVSFQDGQAFVYLRYTFRLSDGRTGLADYSRLRDEPLESDRDTPDTKHFIQFGTALSGIAVPCSLDRNGLLDCEAARRWDLSRPQPISGWGTAAVKAAWLRTCGVATWSFTD